MSWILGPVPSYGQGSTDQVKAIMEKCNLITNQQSQDHGASNAILDSYNFLGGTPGCASPYSALPPSNGNMANQVSYLSVRDQLGPGQANELNRTFLADLAQTDMLRSAMQIWAYDKQYLGKNYDESGAIDAVCKGTDRQENGMVTCKNKSNLALLKATFAQFQASQKIQPTPLKSAQDQTQDVTDFNETIKLLNSFCTATKPKSKKLSLGMNPTDEQMKAYTDQLNSTFETSTEEGRVQRAMKDQFLYSNPLGKLMLVDSFREAVGDPGDDAKGCHHYKEISVDEANQGLQKYKDVIHGSMSKAVNATYLASKDYQYRQTSALEKGETVMNQEHALLANKTIADYVNNKPSVVADVLVHSNKPEYAYNACSYVQHTNHIAGINRWIDIGLMAAGAIAGSLLTFGVGEAFLPIVADGLLLTNAARGGAEAADKQHQKNLQQEDGMEYANPKSIAQSIHAINRLDEEQKEASKKMWTSLTFMGVMKLAQGAKFMATNPEIIRWFNALKHPEDQEIALDIEALFHGVHIFAHHTHSITEDLHVLAEGKDLEEDVGAFSLLVNNISKIFGAVTGTYYGDLIQKESKKVTNQLTEQEREERKEEFKTFLEWLEAPGHEKMAEQYAKKLEAAKTPAAVHQLIQSAIAAN